MILVTDHSAKLPVFRFSYFVTREVVRLYFVTREVVRQCQGVCSLVDSLTVMLCASNLHFYAHQTIDFEVYDLLIIFMFLLLIHGYLPL